MEDNERFEAVKWELGELMRHEKEIRVAARETHFTADERMRTLRKRMDELTGFEKDKAQ